MDLKRAIWISVLLYVATFIMGIIVALVVGTDLTGEESISTTHWILSILVSVVIAALFSLWYFRGKKAKASAKEGFYLGITFLAVGIIFDALFIIPYLFVGGASGVLSYYSDIWFYISVILVVLTPVIIGSMKSK